MDEETKINVHVTDAECCQRDWVLIHMERQKPAEISMQNGNGKESLSCQKGEVRMESWKPRRESVERKDKVGREMTKVRDGDQLRYK